MLKSKVAAGIILIFVILICAFPNISTAEIKVYDNNNQYLGILLYMDGIQTLTVFVKPINASYTFQNLKLEYPNSCIYGERLFFESDDCSGTPYSNGPFPVVIDLPVPPYDKFYLPDSISKKQFLSKSSLGYNPQSMDCECFGINGSSTGIFYKLNEIQLPFTTPIALPVRFDNIVNTSDFFVIPVKKK